MPLFHTHWDQAIQTVEEPLSYPPIWHAGSVVKPLRLENRDGNSEGERYCYHTGGG